MLQLFLVLAAFLVLAYGKDVLEIQGLNFELAVSSHRYLAVLFYDESPTGQSLLQQWQAAAQSITDMPADSELAQISSKDPSMSELIESYELSLPVIRVFRRGIMSEYRGPVDSDGIVAYLQQDAMPSVKQITTLQQMKVILETNLEAVIFGMFSEDDIDEDSAESEGYGIDAWGQFQASADSLRGHATYYAVTSKDVIESFKLTEADLPAIYMMAEEGEGFIKYTGEVLELNLSEWVLRNSSPSMGELTVTTHSGELYATQFFASRKLKFILFIHPNMLHSSSVLETWQDIADTFSGKAIFSYMTMPVADVLEYFSIDLDRDIPIIAAHQPVNDFRYKSQRFNSIEDRDDMLEFVAGVVQGVVPKIIKSEPIPTNKNGQPSDVDSSSYGMRVAVGKTVIDMVSEPDKDVLLAVYTPYCTHCKKFFPSYQILSRAVQAEPRLVVAKINAAANDLPAAWGVNRGFPMLLWFPAKDKPYHQNSSDGDSGSDGSGASSSSRSALPIPRQYWDAGFSAQEMLRFVQREGSFDVDGLRVATMEQLGSLLVDEDMLRAKYEEDERHHRRNEDRETFEDETVDYLMGEVVFDGKRWHIALGAVLAVVNICLIVYLLAVAGLQQSGTASKPRVVAKKKKST